MTSRLTLVLGVSAWIVVGCVCQTVERQHSVGLAWMWMFANRYNGKPAPGDVVVFELDKIGAILKTPPMLDLESCVLSHRSFSGLGMGGRDHVTFHSICGKGWV
jgi:hypothetical protein